MIKAKYLRMTVKRRIFQFADALGVLPHGVDFFSDVRRVLPKERFSLVFDVGANIGQSAERYLVEFPGARILSFEPDPSTFAILSRRFKDHQRVVPAELAFGAVKGQLRFDNRSDLSVLRHLATDQNDDSLPSVAVDTIDNFCAKRGIDHIDLLKIDTEGNDLAVLHGASETLSHSAVSLVMAECSMNRDNRYHASVLKINDFLEALGYRCFGVYDQGSEFRYSGRPVLHLANVVYASPSRSLIGQCQAIS